MAQKTLVQLTDDIDGTEAAETVRFGLDGVGYEIDLNGANAAALRESVARFVQHARRTRAAGSGRAAATTTTGHNAKAVRAWCAANGIEIPARGRIPAAVLAQYHAAGN